MSDIEPPFATATNKLQSLTANVCLLQLAGEFFEFFSLLLQLIFLWIGITGHWEIKVEMVRYCGIPMFDGLWCYMIMIDNVYQQPSRMFSRNPL